MIENSRQNWNFKILHKQFEKTLWWDILENHNQSFQRAFKAHGKKSSSKKQVHLWQITIGIPASYNTIWFKILQDNAFCTRLKKSPKIPIFSTFINNENLQNFEEKNHGLVHGILQYYTSEKYSIIKNQAWAIEKEPAERGKRAVHFRCFCIKCWNRHATGSKQIPWNHCQHVSDSSYSNFVWVDSRDTYRKNFKRIRNYNLEF